MCRILAVFVAVFALAGCTYQYGESSHGEEHANASLLSILADPARFDGRRVWIAGVVHYEFEANGLFLDRESYNLRLTERALWIGPNTDVLGVNHEDLEKLNGRYVRVDGRVDASCQGHFRAYAACLFDVVQIRTLP